MGPIWVRQDPGGPHVGPMNFVIWVNITGDMFQTNESINLYTAKMKKRMILFLVEKSYLALEEIIPKHNFIETDNCRSQFPGSTISVTHDSSL